MYVSGQILINDDKSDVVEMLQNIAYFKLELKKKKMEIKTKDKK